MSKYSEYFKSINTGDSNLYLEKKTNEIVLNNMDYISFYQILHYCYYGRFPNEEKYNIYDYIGIVFQASKFLFDEVIYHCENRLAKMLTTTNESEINEFAKVNI